MKTAEKGAPSSKKGSEKFLSLFQPTVSNLNEATVNEEFNSEDAVSSKCNIVPTREEVIKIKRKSLFRKNIIHISKIQP
jgi:hypothetical protein